jgi:hypothetical protein
MSEAFPHQYEILLTKATSDLQLAIRAYELHDEKIDLSTLLFHLQ